MIVHTDPEGRLTPAQRRYLAEIREAGVKRYNGRARKPLEALEAAGLITVDWDVRPHHQAAWTWILTARPVPSRGTLDS